ncbi:MAG: hypothetical protein OXT67_01955 [Zetaproteobacteria bacterium]|nr:hypothetical protein [Zetaproteobacteria bacterium]
MDTQITQIVDLSFAAQRMHVEHAQVMVAYGRTSSKEIHCILDQMVQNWCRLLEIDRLLIHLSADAEVREWAEKPLDKVTGALTSVAKAADVVDALHAPGISRLYCVLSDASYASHCKDLEWLRYQCWSQNPSFYASTQKMIRQELGSEGVMEASESPLLEQDGLVIRVSQKTRHFAKLKSWFAIDPGRWAAQRDGEDTQLLKTEWPPLFSERGQEGLFLSFTMLHDHEQRDPTGPQLSVRLYESPLCEFEYRANWVGIIAATAHRSVQALGKDSIADVDFYFGVRSRTLGALMAHQLHAHTQVGRLYILSARTLVCCGQALGELMQDMKPTQVRILCDFSQPKVYRWLVVSATEACGEGGDGV